LIINFAPFVLVSCLIWFTLTIVKLIKKKSKLSDVTKNTIFFFYILELIDVTIFPIEIGIRNYPLKPNFAPFKSILELLNHSWYVVALRNIGGNVLLFVPLGVLMPLKNKAINSKWKMIVVACLVSLIIELFQLFVVPSRSADVDDFILNILGGLVGYFFYKLLFFNKQFFKLPQRENV
jgi:glycopeptide antibiotics resistance protein